MAVNRIILKEQDRIVELCRKHQVSRLSVIGSALREDFDPARSDLDFVVEFDVPETSHDGYFELLTDLTELFARKVDLVSWRSARNPYFRREVERSQELLYAT